MSTAEAQAAPPPLAVGSTLDSGFALLRRQPRALLLPQLVINVTALVVGVVIGVVGWLLLGHVATKLETDRQSTFFGDSELVIRKVPQFTDGQTTILVIAVVLIAVVLVWATIAAAVSVVRGAERALAGEPALAVKPAVRQALGATPKLFGLGVVYSIAWLIGIFVLAIVVAIFAEASSGLAVLAGIAAFLLVVYVSVRLFLWPFVHLSEGISFASFGRAWQLSRQRFWALFGVLLLVTIVVFAINFVVSMVLELAVGGLFALDDVAGAVALIPYVALSVVFSLVLVAGYIAPLVVAHRTLAGTDTAALWRAAEAMRQPTPASDAFGRPAAAAGPWAASEPGTWAGSDAAPPPATAGGSDDEGPSDEGPSDERPGGGWARPVDPPGE